MLLGFQIRVQGNQLYGGHNLPPLVGIGLTERPFSPPSLPTNSITDVRGKSHQENLSFLNEKEEFQ